MKTPRHVAIIMDGNGRWAERRHRPRFFGHIRGTAKIKSIVQTANKSGVRALTLYAFSTENWTRPEAELQVLWQLLKKYLRRETAMLERENVRLRILGEVEKLPSDVQHEIHVATERLRSSSGLQLNFAVSYGSRREIARATRLYAEACLRGEEKASTCDEAAFSKYLWTSELGELSEVDLVIRTSGERRVSNFLLWQAAYAEYYFTDLCWPDFGEKDFQQALQDYSQRERRFGGVVAKGQTPSQPAL